MGTDDVAVDEASECGTVKQREGCFTARTRGRSLKRRRFECTEDILAFSASGRRRLKIDSFDFIRLALNKSNL